MQIFKKISSIVDHRMEYRRLQNNLPSLQMCETSSLERVWLTQATLGMSSNCKTKGTGTAHSVALQLTKLIPTGVQGDNLIGTLKVNSEVNGQRVVEPGPHCWGGRLQTSRRR